MFDDNLHATYEKTENFTGANSSPAYIFFPSHMNK